MKLLPALAALLLLAGCSAGVSVGSASYSDGPSGERWCGRSYSAGVGVPGGPGAGGRHGCVTTPPVDED